MKTFSHLQSWPARVAFVAIGAVLTLSAAYTIYNNLKKDNIDGRGTILVVDDCRHVGPWDYDFECTGEYTQGSGMVTISDANVRVTGKYSKGNVIDDIYRDQSISYDASASQQHYLSGEDRRSLLHNLPHVVFVQIGLFLILWPLLSKRQGKT